MRVTSVMLTVMLGVALSGCVGATKTRTIPIIETKLVVPDVPDRYFDCRSPILPDTKNLTDKQVADLLARYDNSIKKCRADALSVKSILRKNEQSLRRK